MKLYVNKLLFGLMDKPIYLSTEGANEERVQAKLGDICMNALMADTDQNEPGNKKFHRYQLARGVNNKMKEDTTEMAFLEINVEDLELVKSKVGRTYGANVVGPAFTAIEV